MFLYHSLENVLKTVQPNMTVLEQITIDYLKSLGLNFEFKLFREKSYTLIQVSYIGSVECICEIAITSSNYNTKLPVVKPHLIPRYEFFRWCLYREIVIQLQQIALKSRFPEIEVIQPNWQSIDRPGFTDRSKSEISNLENAIFVDNHDDLYLTSISISVLNFIPV